MTDDNSRIVIADTETTGFDPKNHRIVEIGCALLSGREWSGESHQWYINPCRSVSDSIKVHGLSNDFLADKPKFDQVCSEFLEVVKGTKLVMHNASFDVSFLNMELGRCGLGAITDYCEVIDTLALARKRFPMQKNSLDALCSRFGVDNSNRELHGALKDSVLLLNVYLALTRKQNPLFNSQAKQEEEEVEGYAQVPDTKVIYANDLEIQSHRKFFENNAKKLVD
ncbi:MAG TPA: DNA polymerase III subunit epsilon [Gammaproteobacteria bacterium]|nr:DNA polymerase III subunit epsilon [Gammaproteobacteria bacterium]